MSVGVDLLVIGDANPDIVLHGAPATLAYGQAEQLAESGTLTVGGSAAILACGAARLGLRTGLVAAVGDDAAGRFMLDELRAHGVEVCGCHVVENTPSGITVGLARGDDRAIVTFPGCIDALTADMVDPGLLGGARHVHVSSFFLQPRMAAGLRSLFAAARSVGAGTSLDPNWDPAERWDGGLADVLPAVDVLFVNAAEAAAVSGAADPVEAATALAAHGPLAVIKLGAAGALAHDGSRLSRVSAPAVTVVDTVGCGDSFDAGFLCGLSRGWDVSRCLALGVACGTLCARGAGGVTAQPTREEALHAVADPLPRTGGDAEPKG